MASSHPSLIAAARDRIADARERALGGRVLVGIAGAPGAGKSTLATSVATALIASGGPDAAIAVGMDGFHLANDVLARLGLTERKGAPETFDPYGFLGLVRRLRSADEPIVYAPTYSRTLHESIGSAVAIPAAVRTVVIEGNYLLLDQTPWDEVRKLLDLVIYLDTPTSLRVPSLLRRQRSRGLDHAAAVDWVYRSDEANAAIVAVTRDRADVVLTRPE